jgi:enoyl-CoA hydratase
MGNILYEKKGHVGYVTINRPEVLNCFNFDALTELGNIAEQIYIDRDIRVVVFTGAGEKVFSAGADLKERKTLNEAQVRRNVNKIRTVFNQIADLPQPTIAAVNGHAFGGGFELMLACDFRIAGSEAKMGLTEVSLAIIPGAGGTQRLPRLIGESKAKELIFTGRRITAGEAYDYGILTKVVDRSNLMGACEELANEMTKNGPVALIQAKFAVSQGLNVDLITGMAIEAKAYEVTIPTKDRLEALEAFSEKRDPEFKGE